MYEIILEVLKDNFPQYNEYKLGKIAQEINNKIKIVNDTERVTLKSCVNCVHFQTLIVTFVGENPNLCQMGRKKGDAIGCPYYTENKWPIVTSDSTVSSYIWRG